MEFALLSPWMLFLFVGVLDWGYYSHALIATENAARAAALYTSTDNSTAGSATGACERALAVMRSLPNVGSSLTACSANPVTVTAAAVAGPDGRPASQVWVRYQTIPMIPIPGLLRGRLTVTRSVKMGLRK